jgi:hypothetical protein
MRGKHPVEMGDWKLGHSISSQTSQVEFFIFIRNRLLAAKKAQQKNICI